MSRGWTLVLWAAMAGCVAPQQDLPIDQLAPPGSMQIETTPLWLGYPATITISDAPAGAMVRLFGTGNRNAPPDCPAFLAGLCLDIGGTLDLGSTSADSRGRAPIRVDIPPRLPLSTVALQGGAAGHTSNVVIRNFINPWRSDLDGDLVPDGAELDAGTDPLSPDSDGDGLDDYEEVVVHGTDPLSFDSDGDYMSDGSEVTQWGTDPLDRDSDDDGLGDGAEIALGTDPYNSDSDGDTLSDFDEQRVHGTDPNNADGDDGGLSDACEVALGADPSDPGDDPDYCCVIDEGVVSDCSESCDDANDNGVCDELEVCTPAMPCTCDSLCEDDACTSWEPGEFDNTCVTAPEVSAIEMAVQCRWESPPDGDPRPNHDQVMSTPVVLDFDFDGDPGTLQPSIVFSTFQSGGYFNAAYLRVIDGGDCAHQHTIDFPVAGGAAPALGDINGDGRPDIVATGDQGGMTAFSYNPGTDSWEQLFVSRDCETGLQDFHRGIDDWAGPALHDLDDDGVPEILLDDRVYDNQGCILDPGGIYGAYSKGIIPVVADVDGDGMANIMRGNVLREWSAGGWVEESWFSGGPAGQVALADIGDYPLSSQDGEDAVEIVVVSVGSVRVTTLEGDVVFGPTFIPGGGIGGPPTVADFDGDGQREIGVAGAVEYVVFDPDCVSTATSGDCASGRTDGILWSRPSNDSSSNVTGSSVFDVNGDGAAEVVYADQCFLRIYDGTDGSIIDSIARTSGTAYENPIIADVDGDLASEIVTSVNDYDTFGCSGPDPLLPSTPGEFSHGIMVLRDTDDAWVSTRAVWNQHAYSITNIEDDGTIPRTSEVVANWSGGGNLNNFRQNTPGQSFEALGIPDLTVQCEDQGEVVCLPEGFEVSTVVCNRGALPLLQGEVGLTVGDERGVEVCLATFDQLLPPGDCITVSCISDVLLEGADIYVRADPHDILEECDESNNVGVIVSPVCAPCAVDDNNNGICDELEPCADADLDGTCDTEDPCPADPIDLCLDPCFPDVDSDLDGTCDSEDPCPADPDDVCGDCFPDGDEDGDGVCDLEDICPFEDDFTCDSDGDFLFDLEELALGTDPFAFDTDGDGLSDGEEVYDWFTDPLSEDSDIDGLTDGEEVWDWATDPFEPDSDFDGLFDGEEVYDWATDPLDPDSDFDTLFDGDEVLLYGTDPLMPDSDGDFLDDNDEIDLGTDPNNFDSDGDELEDGDEVYNWFTDPLNPDSDGDGVPDGEEVNTWFSDPTLEDTDGDMLLDGDEVYTWLTDPTIEDVDGDGLLDGEEVLLGTNPSEFDSDGDGVDDGEEFNTGLDPNNVDSDGDDLLDGEELFTWLTDPLTTDTDGDGIGDGNEVLVWFTDPTIDDTDGDMILDGDETDIWFTDPLEPDTDGDGLDDGDELDFWLTDPTEEDSDGDTLLDGEEVDLGTDPIHPDSDLDNLDDGEEVDLGTDPLNPDSDGDGLDDGDEIDENTDPNDPDSDGGGLPDGLEVDLGLDPNDPSDDV